MKKGNPSKAETSEKHDKTEKERGPQWGCKVERCEKLFTSEDKYIMHEKNCKGIDSVSASTSKNLQKLAKVLQTKLRVDGMTKEGRRAREEKKQK